jgi:uncharacterized protein
MIRVILFIALFLTFVTSVQASEPIVLKTDSGELYGTLEIPEYATTLPVVLIIAGSGPTDRDGNNPLSGKNNSLKMLSKKIGC